MLYLHGGLPDYFLTRKYPTGFEDHFTVVWWEQRGSGPFVQYRHSTRVDDLDQMISDIKEVDELPRNRFGQEKIFLMGRSGGTSSACTWLRNPRNYIMHISGWHKCRIHLSRKDCHMNTCFPSLGKTETKNGTKVESAPVTISEGTSPAYLSNYVTRQCTVLESVLPRYELSNDRYVHAFANLQGVYPKRKIQFMAGKGPIWRPPALEYHHFYRFDPRSE